MPIYSKINMARKKSYIKVAEETLVNGENWQEVYEELKSVTPAQMQERIQVIDAETKKMESEIVRRQTTGRLGNNSNKAENEQTVNEMIDISTQLQGERNILEAFPKVDKRMKTVEAVKRRAEKRKAEEAKALEEAKRRLREAKEKQKELSEKMGEIDEELVEARDALKTMKGKTAINAIKSTIADLEGRKAALGDKSAVDKAVEDAKKDLVDYNKRTKCFR